MVIITKKQVLQNSHSIRGIVLLMVLFILAFLSSGCQKQPERVDAVQQIPSSHSGTNKENSFEKQQIIVHLSGLPEDVKKLVM